jgi:hypothetical protein
MSSIVSEQYQFVIGVDTHAATHTFALVAGATSAVLDHAVFPTSAAGLSRAEGWLARRVGDAPTLVVIEGLLRCDFDRAFAVGRARGGRSREDARW